MKLRLLLVASLCASLALQTTTAQAVTAERGLAVTPLRQYLDVEAGTPTNGTLTLYNLTQKDLDITVSVEEFSVSDYAYEYQFSPPRENIVHIHQPQYAIKSGKSQEVAFSVLAPPDSAPGGRYFTIIASAQIQNDKAQVATPLYIAVKGNQTFTHSLQNHSAPSMVFGKQIDLGLDIKNDGNTHFFAYTNATVDGLFARTAEKSPHLLLPGTVRHIDTRLPSPLLPGVYRLRYGYTTDISEPAVIEKYIIYTPVWFYAVLIALAWTGVHLPKWLKTRRAPTDSRR